MVFNAAEAVSVLVIDDHPVVATGVQTVLRGSRARVIAAASSVERGVRVAQERRPDVILLDLRLDGGVLGASEIRALQAAAPETRIVLFTAFPEHPMARAAIEAGAVGCLVKDTGSNDLVAGVIAAAEDRPLPNRTATGPDASLSPREYEILLRVSIGETNAEIGRQLLLAPNTVKTYWQNALYKLGARNRADAIRRAYAAGIL
jgi:two-component system, NarL family, nitrate/nitrite response regulator NarL